MGDQASDRDFSERRGTEMQRQGGFAAGRLCFGHQRLEALERHAYIGRIHQARIDPRRRQQ
jgi:hypothetical protein